MKNKQIIFSMFFVITVTTIIGLGLKAREFNKILSDLDSQITFSKAELNKDVKRLEELKKEKESMNSPEYIEKVAREKLGMVKKDDIVFKQK
ncbi:MAG: FtsB family cell division protein [Cellulosilyticaceae bacterium]